MLYEPFNFHTYLYIYEADGRSITLIRAITSTNVIDEDIVLVQIGIVENNTSFLLQTDLPLSNYHPNLMKSDIIDDEIFYTK